MQLPVPDAPNPPPPFGVQNPDARADTAEQIRILAAQFERKRALPNHKPNDDEKDYADRIGNYSKGLNHNEVGVVERNSYESFLAAIASGKPEDFSKIITNANIPLVNPQAGLAFDLLGADSHALCIPPAWPVLSWERAAEALELYWMALCRDIPFSLYGLEPVTQAAIAELNSVRNLLFENKKEDIFHGAVTSQTLFRGNTPGEKVGPYVSQFFLQAANFGALAVPAQQYNVYVPGIDYMTDADSWLKVQNGISPLTPVPPSFQFGPNLVLGPRFLFSGRAGSAFVHVDELYQAYFMAALNLLDAMKTNDYDQNNPYQRPNPLYPREAGFGTFGNPHVATLVAEVATRALKAQWYQKWFVHRTLRPEAYGGLVHFAKIGKRNDYQLPDFLLRSYALQFIYNKYGTYFLPMVFPEGSPQHPSYGSGHATVGGACATIIKAFFDEDFVLQGPVQASTDGTSIPPYTGNDAAELTIGGEANKIAGNVGMFRNHAGVHWRSDHEQSILLGEKIAISILQDQKWQYNEPFAGWKFTTFEGEPVTI